MRGPTMKSTNEGTNNMSIPPLENNGSHSFQFTAIDTTLICYGNDAYSHCKGLEMLLFGNFSIFSQKKLVENVIMFVKCDCAVEV